MLDVVRRNSNWNSYLRSIRIDETERIALERDTIGPSFAVIGHLILIYIHMHHFAQSRCYYWVNVSQRRVIAFKLKLYVNCTLQVIDNCCSEDFFQMFVVSLI